jgi:hypothetical protein
VGDRQRQRDNETTRERELTNCVVYSGVIFDWASQPKAAPEPLAEGGKGLHSVGGYNADGTYGTNHHHYAQLDHELSCLTQKRA